MTLKAKGGLKPYRWSIVAGDLPDGLVLDTDTGRISGTATVPGIFPVTVQVADVFDITQGKNLAVEIE